jgi:hypothetical protein
MIRTTELPMTATPSSMPKPNLRKLTGPQLRTILETAQVVRQRSRNQFLQHVADALEGKPDPGEGDVWKAIRSALALLHVERTVLL